MSSVSEYSKAADLVVKVRVRRSFAFSFGTKKFGKLENSCLFFFVFFSWHTKFRYQLSLNLNMGGGKTSISKIVCNDAEFLANASG